MKTKQASKTRLYRLTKDRAPLSWTLSTGTSKRTALLYFDEEKQENRVLRYASNQRSPFEDEQDGNVVLEPIVFEDGFLTVPANKPVLQEFLYYHPKNGIDFEEIDKEQEAQEDISFLEEEVDALIKAKSLSIDELEQAYRVLFNTDPDTVTTAEMKRDILVYARREPHNFSIILDDPQLQLHNTVRKIFSANLLSKRNKGRDVYFNTPSNKKRMLVVPYGEDANDIVASHFQTEEGVESLKMLEKLLEQ